MPLVIIILSLLPLIIALSYIITRKKYDILEPYTFFCIIYVVFPLFSGIYIAGYGGLIGTIYFSESYTFLRSYVWAGLIFSFCFLFFTMGYLIPKKDFKAISRVLTRSPNWGGGKLLIFGGIFLLVSFYGIIQFIETMEINFSYLSSFSSKHFKDVAENGYSAASGYLRWLASLSEIVFLAGCAFMFIRQRKLTVKISIIFTILFIFAIIFPVLTSSRGSIIILMISALVMWHYAMKPIKLKALLIYGIFAFLILATLGAMRKGVDDPKEIIAYYSPFKIVETIGSRPNSGYVNLANIIKKMPSSWNYQYGKTLFSWIVAPIPRSYWPDKPPINIGQQIKTNIYTKAKRGGGGVPTNSIGEFYINFGIFGIFYVLFWWLIGGMITKKIYLTFRSHLQSNPTALMLYIVLLFYFLPYIFTGSFSHTFIKFLTTLLPTLLLIVLVKSNSPNKRLRVFNS